MDELYLTKHTGGRCSDTQSMLFHSVAPTVTYKHLHCLLAALNTQLGSGYLLKKD